MPRVLVIVLCLLFCLPPGLAAAQVATWGEGESSPPDPSRASFEVLLEGGLALPLGNLGAGFRHTETGMGAEQGYRLGIRTRFALGGGLSLAPVLAFTEFGDLDGVDDTTGKTVATGVKFKVRGSTLRYGLDLAWLAPPDASPWRAYAAAGVGLAQHRYLEDLPEEEISYDDSIYAFAWMLSVGVRGDDFEVALEYHASRFETGRFFRTLADAEYVWNHAVLRVGYVLPRF
jgi:hypothetical protein